MKTKHLFQIGTLLILAGLLFMQCKKDETETPVPLSPQFTISPSNGEFGEVLISKEVSIEFNIKNKGQETLKISSIVLDGKNKSEFKTNGTPTSVEANSNGYKFTVTFAPKSKGEKVATLKITDSAGTNTVKLKGVAKESSSGESTQSDMGKDVKIMFLHHSTGKHIWDGGVESSLAKHSGAQGKKYAISETLFPSGDYENGWSNYPYDYWNIWVKNAGNTPLGKEPTLEILTKEYNVIIWKHCYPVSNIGPDNGVGDLNSKNHTIPNFKVQYDALKKKMKSFPNTRFIVWTGAVRIESQLPEEQAKRAKKFFDWVKNTWDEKGDNIYVFDFYELETEGSLYLKPEYANSSSDSHPNASFSQKVAPLFSQRIVDVIQGKGDTGSLTGK